MEAHTKKTSHIATVPVVIVGHLLHDLAIDLIPEHLMFHGGPKDLVGELKGTLHLLGGVISHIFQDRCASVKDENTTPAHDLTAELAPASEKNCPLSHRSLNTM